MPAKFPAAASATTFPPEAAPNNSAQEFSIRRRCHRSYVAVFWPMNRPPPSLAYFTLLAFFPLVALIILAFAHFADPDSIRERISEIFLYFFPASQEFFNTAVDHLFQAPLAAGLVAVIGILLGANGLFMAAHRGVNRIFGSRPRRMLGTTLLEIAIATTVVLLFLVSIGLTIVFQIALGLSAALPVVGGPVSRLLVTVTGLASAVLPVFLTAFVFTLVYRYVPNLPVKWQDATFGAIVAVVLFEAAKHMSFWFGNIASQRSLLYGSLSSVVILLIWAFAAGLIFLFGASLTKQSAELRPIDPRKLRWRDSRPPASR